MTTKAQIQPQSTGLATFNAARWNVGVLITGTDILTPANRVWLNGLTKFEPTQDPTTQDDTDIFSRGFKSQLVTATSEDASAEGLIKGPKAAGGATVDPGLAFMREKRHLIGQDNVATLMYWRSDQLQDYAIVQDFAVKWKDVGGSNEDLQKFTMDLMGRGAPLRVARPLDLSKTLTVAINTTPTTSVTLTTPYGDTAAITTVTAAGIKSALEALSGIGAGGATVTEQSTTATTKTFLIFIRGVLSGADVTVKVAVPASSATTADPS